MAVSAVLSMVLHIRGCPRFETADKVFWTPSFGFVSGHDLSRAANELKEIGLYRLRKNAGPGVALDFSPGKGFSNPLKRWAIKFGALALVATSEAVCDFFRSLFSPCHGTSHANARPQAI